MRTRISQRMQIGILYTIPGLWYALCAFACLRAKAGPSFSDQRLDLFVDVAQAMFILFAPIVYLYLLIRFAFVEHEFIRKHPFPFYGCVALGFLPWIIFCTTVLLHRL